MGIRAYRLKRMWVNANRRKGCTRLEHGVRSEPGLSGGFGTDRFYDLGGIIEPVERRH